MSKGLSPRAISARNKEDGIYSLNVKNKRVTGLTLSSGVLLLGLSDPVPEDTPVGTVILRKTS